MKKYICDMCERTMNIGNRKTIDIGSEKSFDVCFDCAKKINDFIEGNCLSENKKGI